jgi:hypothetical protein
MYKFWGGNWCGVSKNRDSNHNIYRFAIYSPSYIRQDEIKDLKKKYWVKLMNDIGAVRQYDWYDSSHLLNEEQMRKIVAKTKYINVLIDAEKYNL